MSGSIFDTIDETRFVTIIHFCLGYKRYSETTTNTTVESDIKSLIKDSSKNKNAKDFSLLLKNKIFYPNSNEIVYTKVGAAFLLLYLQTPNVIKSYKDANIFFMEVLKKIDDVSYNRLKSTNAIKQEVHFLLWFGFRYYVNIVSNVEFLDQYQYKYKCQEAILQSSLIDFDIPKDLHFVFDDKIQDVFCGIFENLNYSFKFQLDNKDIKHYEPTLLQIIYSHPYCILTDEISNHFDIENHTDIAHTDVIDDLYIYQLPNSENSQKYTFKSIDQIFEPFLGGLQNQLDNKDLLLHNIFCVSDICKQSALNKELRLVLKRYKKYSIFQFQNKLSLDLLEQVWSYSYKRLENINKQILKGDYQAFVFVAQEMKQSINVDLLSSSNPILLNFVCLVSNDIFINSIDNPSFEYNSIFALKNDLSFLNLSTSSPVFLNNQNMFKHDIYSFDATQENGVINNVLNVKIDDKTIGLYNFIQSDDITSKENSLFSAYADLFGIKLSIDFLKLNYMQYSYDGNFTLKLNNIKIFPNNTTDDIGSIDSLYLHNCENKQVYKSQYVKKISEPNIYEATFTIHIDNSSKKASKLIISTEDLSKKQIIKKDKNGNVFIASFSTSDIHQASGTAIVSVSHKDKESGNLDFDKLCSLQYHDAFVCKQSDNKSISNDISNLSVFIDHNECDKIIKFDKEGNVSLKVKTFYDKTLVGDVKDIRYVYAVIDSKQLVSQNFTNCHFSYLASKENENSYNGFIGFENDITLSNASDSNLLMGADELDITLKIDIKDGNYTRLRDKKLIIYATNGNNNYSKYFLESCCVFDFAFPLVVEIGYDELKLCRLGENPVLLDIKYDYYLPDLDGCIIDVNKINPNNDSIEIKRKNSNGDFINCALIDTEKPKRPNNLIYLQAPDKGSLDDFIKELRKQVEGLGINIIDVRVKRPNLVLEVTRTHMIKTKLKYYENWVTFSDFKFVAYNDNAKTGKDVKFDNQDVNGVIVEPAGYNPNNKINGRMVLDVEQQKTEGTDTRIPEGEYQVFWKISKKKHFIKDNINTTFKNSTTRFKPSKVLELRKTNGDFIYNRRDILIHLGNYGADTKGCLLPNKSKNINLHMGQGSSDMLEIIGNVLFAHDRLAYNGEERGYNKDVVIRNFIIKIKDSNNLELKNNLTLNKKDIEIEEKLQQQKNLKDKK